MLSVPVASMPMSSTDRWRPATRLSCHSLGSEATVYLSVISAVASGATRQSQIADRAGVSPSSSAGKYLSQLRRLHILDHVRPAGAPESARSGVSLVVGIDSDPVRQALIVGMRHFAQSAGCRLIAEGIETEAELAALLELQVSLGQGYLLGRPVPPVAA